MTPCGSIGMEGTMTSTKETTADEFYICRDGDLDLMVRGRRIACAKYGNASKPEDWTRGTTVVVILTTTGRIVTGVKQWSANGASHRAAIHGTAAEALQWFRDDNHGVLGRASKDAWEQACDAAPEVFSGHEVAFVE